jgi:hypothetical protein
MSSQVSRAWKKGRVSKKIIKEKVGEFNNF